MTTLCCLYAKLFSRPMTAIDQALAANTRFAVNYDPDQISPRPRLGLAVLTCMDTRLSLPALGLRPQDAHVIRNAGGIVTDDALRSLLISHYVGVLRAEPQRWKGESRV